VARLEYDVYSGNSVISGSVDDNVDTNVDMLLVRVVELAITDPNKSDANKEPTGSSNKLAVAFIMSTKIIQQKSSSHGFQLYFLQIRQQIFGYLTKKFSYNYITR
jgi:hypothetical protein